MPRLSLLGVPVLASVVAMPALAQADAGVDPWESVNRKVYAFNDTLDTYVARPVAVAYRDYTPALVQQGLSNFFDNLFEVRTIFNDALQGKWGQTGQDSARFLVNTTVGVLGIVDVASRIDLPAHNEDFGQTLAVWGVPQGPYVVLPFLGPSTVRDASGRIPDYNLKVTSIPSQYYGMSASSWVVWGGDAVVTRAGLLSAEGLLVGDKYTLMRDAYLQRRQFLINDGKASDDLLKNDMGEDFFKED